MTETSPTLPVLHTIQEAAALLRVSPETVRRLALREKIGSLAIGDRRFITQEDLEAFVAANRTPARPNA